MTKYLRRLPMAVLALAVLVVPACDSGTDPVATATVQVTAYIDVNNSMDSDGGDEAIEGATITLSLVGGGAGDLTATTNATGVATFADVDIGSYTVAIEPPASLSGVTLASASTPTVVADEDATATAEFRYTYNPGLISGHVFLGSGSYTAGDLVIPDVPVTVSQGGTEINTVYTDETGAYAAGGLLPGDYTVTVDVPAYLTTPNASQTATVIADAAATADFGMEPNATHTVAEARAAAVDDTVSIIGVAITGNSGDQAVFSSSSFFMQDDSGISIFLAGVTASVELGDSVLVYGERGSFNDEVQLASLAVLVLGPGTLPTPTPVTASDLNGNLYQGQLGLLQDVIVDSIPGTSNTSGEVWVSEFTTGEDVALYIDSDTGFDLGATFTVGSAYDVTGVMSRYFDLFELKPRMPADVTEETGLPMSIAEARAEVAGTQVTVTGIVTTGTEDPGSLTTSSIYIQDATAGIQVYGGGSTPADLGIGDVVEVTGTVGSFQDHLQIDASAGTITELRTASAPAARPVTAAEVTADQYQGELGIVTDAVVDSISGSSAYISDTAGDDLQIFFDSDAGIAAGSLVVGETYAITGIVTTYFGPTYQMLPRMPEDVEGAVAIDTLTTVAEARAAADGEPVELTGVVTVTNGPSAMLDFRNAYMQDATAGILIRMPSDSVVTLGDSVTVTGTTGTFVQERQINVTGLTRHGAGTVPTPRVVTTADIEAGLYQGELAELQGVEVTAINGAEVTVQDGTGTTIVYIDSTTGIDVNATFTVGTVYDVTGVVSRYNTTFELKPRQASDIVIP